MLYSRNQEFEGTFAIRFLRKLIFIQNRSFSILCFTRKSRFVFGWKTLLKPLATVSSPKPSTSGGMWRTSRTSNAKTSRIMDVGAMEITGKNNLCNYYLWKKYLPKFSYYCDICESLQKIDSSGDQTSLASQLKGINCPQHPGFYTFRKVQNIRGSLNGWEFF